MEQNYVMFSSGMTPTIVKNEREILVIARFIGKKHLTDESCNEFIEYLKCSLKNKLTKTSKRKFYFKEGLQTAKDRIINFEILPVDNFDKNKF